MYSILLTPPSAMALIVDSPARYPDLLPNRLLWRWKKVVAWTTRIRKSRIPLDASPPCLAVYGTPLSELTRVAMHDKSNGVGAPHERS